MQFGWPGTHCIDQGGLKLRDPRFCLYSVRIAHPCPATILFFFFEIRLFWGEDMALTVFLPSSSEGLSWGLCTHGKAGSSCVILLLGRQKDRMLELSGVFKTKRWFSAVYGCFTWIKIVTKGQSNTSQLTHLPGTGFTFAKSFESTAMLKWFLLQRKLGAARNKLKSFIQC